MRRAIFGKGDSPLVADREAEDRDRAAAARDKASEARDRRAEVRDAIAEDRELWTQPDDAAAASDRAEARVDRLAGASDRDHASADRGAASMDRSVAASDRAANLVDELTGAYRRDAGTLELEREIAMAKRTNRPFVVAFIDVDGLKVRNDSRGHAAGDDLLSQIVATLRRHTRPYDVIVRYGGDEFVCGLLDVGLQEAAERFARIDKDLQVSGASVSTGLAELGPDDGLEDLVRRADASLYRSRGLREGSAGSAADLPD